MLKERKQIRLTEWSYSSKGIYFITMCCHNRESFLAKIVDKKVILTEIGVIANQYWFEIPNHYPNVVLDEFVVMPNHIHGILIISANPDLEHHLYKKVKVERLNQFSKPLKQSVSMIINQYKSSVKRWCNKNGFSDFQWQSRFYESIVRNEKSIDRVREYIRNNPNKWQTDN